MNTLEFIVEFIRDVVRLYIETPYDPTTRGRNAVSSLTSLINSMEKLYLKDEQNPDWKNTMDLLYVFDEVLAWYAPGDPSPKNGLFGDEKFHTLIAEIREGFEKYDVSHDLRDLVPNEYSDNYSN